MRGSSNVRPLLRRFLLGFAAAGLLAGGAFSQQPQPPSIRVKVDVVSVGVSVTDAQGHFASGLSRENFRVFDNGVEQPITNFLSMDEPAQVLVMVETGPAVYLLEREHLQAAYALMSGLAADDRVALAAYDDAAHPLMDFTTDKSAVADALANLRYNLGMAQLNLLDSLDTALGWLGPLPGKSAIVLLSTGLDTSAPGRWQELEQKLRASQVVVLAVALGVELRSPGKTAKQKKKTRGEAIPTTEASFEEADRTLREVAAATGGRAYFPVKARDFQTIYAEIATLLRHQYSLGFKPPSNDGRYHKIEVSVVDSAGQPFLTPKGQPLYRVDHRQGYFAVRSETQETKP
jgi:Ca-activated chloride channel homolog